MGALNLQPVSQKHMTTWTWDWRLKCVQWGYCYLCPKCLPLLCLAKSSLPLRLWPIPCSPFPFDTLIISSVTLRLQIHRRED